MSTSRWQANSIVVASLAGKALRRSRRVELAKRRSIRGHARIHFIVVLVTWFHLYPTAVAHADCSPTLLFDVPKMFATGHTSPMAEPVLADITGDGTLDCVVVGPIANGPVQLSVLPGAGDGTFGGALSYSLANFNGSNMALADFNGDGLLDVAYPASPSGISVMLGGGTSGIWDGTFGPPRNTALVGYESSQPRFGKVAAGDFDSDGRSDLAVSVSFHNGPYGLYLFTFRGFSIPDESGGGVFSVRAETPLLLGEANTGSVLVQDLNADGASDLLATGELQTGYLTKAFVLLGREELGVPNGTFNLPRITDMVPGVSAWVPTVSHFDSDSTFDLAYVNPNDGTARIQLGLGGDSVGYFAADVAYDAGSYPYSIASADFDGDGVQDAAVSNALSGIAVLRGRQAAMSANGTLAAPIGYSGLGLYVHFVTSRDINADGKPDLVATAYGSNATVTGERILVWMNQCVETSAEHPRLASVRDVPLDQGGRVKLSWFASAHDVSPGGIVDEYWIWRSTPSDAARAAVMAGAGDFIISATSRPLPGRRLFMRSSSADSFWEFVVSQPAGALPSYSYTARTTTDSTSFGNPYTTFFIEARSSDGQYRWDSPPDSGYSVDNLPPRRLMGIGGFYAPPSNVTIHWPPSREEDLSHYVVYSGTSRDFPISPARRLAVTADTVQTANSFNRTTFFKVTSVDIHGNESEPITLAPGQVSGVENLGVPPIVFLSQNHPNPFNPETTIEFGVPITGKVTLRVYDASGRLVRTLLDEDRPAGTHSVRWDGRDARGVDMPSGVYVAKLGAVGSTKAVKLVLAR